LFHCGHIREKDGLHHSLANKLDFFGSELSAEEVVIVDVEELDRLSGMEVLLDVLLTIHLTDRRLSNDVIAVIVTIVLHVMAKSRYK
jgi:hypothetical protein